MADVDENVLSVLVSFRCYGAWWYNGREEFCHNFAC